MALSDPIMGLLLLMMGCSGTLNPGQVIFLSKIWETKGGFPFKTKLFAWMFDAAGVAEFEEQYQALAVPQPVQVLISALVIMSDWIASNSDFFPLTFRVESWEEFRLRADAAWVSFALPSSWHAENRELEDEDFFHRRFAGLP